MQHENIDLYIYKCRNNNVSTLHTTQHRRNNMLNTYLDVNTVIDTVQNAKRELINSVIPQESVAKPAIAILEAETSFAKSLAETTQKYFDTVADTFATIKA